MPFFSDIDSRDESRGPIWGPFSTIRDNVERLVAINIAWAVQLLPGILALAFQSIPLWLRIVMCLYSATVIIPATGALYGLALAASGGEHLSVELSLEMLRKLAVPSFRKLTPLFGTFGVLIWIGILAGPVVPGLTTLITLICLLWYLCATYWGPVFVIEDHLSTMAIAKRSVGLVWEYPLETLLTCGVVTFALAIGLVSIGGVFLIVPVVITLLQVQRYLDLTRRGNSNSIRSA